MHYDYDIFLSYKSEDSEWVEKLKRALQKRGVLVWLDDEQIRPGDLSVQALEDGIATSRAVAIIVTPQSMRSHWVKEEYHRAQALCAKGELRLIPCVLEDTELPGFLANKNPVWFTKPSRFEISVDRLVWPGITGKTILAVSFSHNIMDQDWQNLRDCFFEELGLTLYELSETRIDSWFKWVKRRNRLDDFPTYGHEYFPPDKVRGVVVLDMLHFGHSWTEKCVNFIQKCKDSRDGINEEIVFVLYHRHDWITDLVASGVSDKVVKQLSNYFVIEKGKDRDALKQGVRSNWQLVMQDLKRYE